jgi:hypothetical protein
VALTESEATTLRSKMVKLVDFERPKAGVVRMSFRAGGARSVGASRALASERQVRSAVEKLLGDGSGFIEIENCLGNARTLSWHHNSYFEQSEPERRPTRIELFDDWIRAFVRPPLPPGWRAAAPQPSGRSFERLDPHATLETEGGVVVDGLVEWQLIEELERISPGGSNRFAVLSFADERYIQTFANDDGSFDVAFRDGGPADHYRSSTPVDRKQMIDLFVKYGHGRDFKAGVRWAPVRTPQGCRKADSNRLPTQANGTISGHCWSPYAL